MAKFVLSKLAPLRALTALVALTTSIYCAPGAFAQEKQEKASRPHIDLAFCIDTTGSMQSEIDNVKAKTKEIVAKLAGGKPAPVIRVGLVAFRDRGDEYVTKVFPFTQDIDNMVKDISNLRADGGGDTPESVNEALHVAVNDLSWSKENKTLKLLFLIGDAGPHFYPNDYDWHVEARKAIKAGIQINTIGCQGLESSTPTAEGVDVFKQIASLADGKYEPLSYRHEIARADGKKETIVTSGGAAYRLAPEAATAWKDGADALAGKGKAARLEASSVAAMAAPMPLAKSSARLRAAGAPAAADMAYGGGGAALQSREENNLTDLVLKATRDAARKKLKVDFK